VAEIHEALIMRAKPIFAYLVRLVCTKEEGDICMITPHEPAYPVCKVMRLQHLHWFDSQLSKGCTRGDQRDEQDTTMVAA
jgi:hypothetical protein